MTIRNFVGLAAMIGGLTCGGLVQARSWGGASSQVTSVRAFAADVYRLGFYGGEPARVLLKGDGDTDLDLYIYDEYGNMVASDTDDDDLCIAEWVPRRSGVFTIRVVNHGPVYNRYRIVIN